MKRKQSELLDVPPSTYNSVIIYMALGHLHLASVDDVRQII